MNYYDKKNKRYLYLIIDLYISKEIDENTFCDEFYKSYDLELDYSTLTKEEIRFFNELNKVVSRFSPYQDDHNLDSHAFSTIEELRKKVLETKLGLGELSK